MGTLIYCSLSIQRYCTAHALQTWRFPSSDRFLSYYNTVIFHKLHEKIFFSFKSNPEYDWLNYWRCTVPLNSSECPCLQIAANVVIFVCVNVVGVLLHTLMEHAQRRAFLDTRNCIAARLEMEDENEKLVWSTLYPHWIARWY